MSARDSAARKSADASTWYRDRQARSLILFRYLPWLAALSLGWEIAQLPLYALWKQASAAYIAFSVAHCSVGDVLIGAGALAAALVITRAPALTGWQWRHIALLTAIVATSYTAFSEWMNTVALRSWEYSDLMPRAQIGNIEIGLSPLAQWLVLPPLALYLSRRDKIIAWSRNR
jgi:hypothetical protein